MAVHRALSTKSSGRTLGGAADAVDRLAHRWGCACRSLAPRRVNDPPPCPGRRRPREHVTLHVSRRPAMGCRFTGARGAGGGSGTTTAAADSRRTAPAGAGFAPVRTGRSSARGRTDPRSTWTRSRWVEEAGDAAPPAGLPGGRCGRCGIGRRGSWLAPNMSHALVRPCRLEGPMAGSTPGWTIATDGASLWRGIGPGRGLSSRVSKVDVTIEIRWPLPTMVGGCIAPAACRVTGPKPPRRRTACIAACRDTAPGRPRDRRGAALCRRGAPEPAACRRIRDTPMARHLVRSGCRMPHHSPCPLVAERGPSLLRLWQAVSVDVGSQESCDRIAARAASRTAAA